jgi:hypothetical protein
MVAVAVAHLQLGGEPVAAGLLLLALPVSQLLDTVQVVGVAVAVALAVLAV